VHQGEELEERLLEAALRHDAQPFGARQLQVAPGGLARLDPGVQCCLHHHAPFARRESGLEELRHADRRAGIHRFPRSQDLGLHLEHALPGAQERRAQGVGLAAQLPGALDGG
jgi:hypothetical protein